MDTKYIKDEEVFSFRDTKFTKYYKSEIKIVGDLTELFFNSDVSKEEKTEILFKFITKHINMEKFIVKLLADFTYSRSKERPILREIFQEVFQKLPIQIKNKIIEMLPKFLYDYEYYVLLGTLFPLKDIQELFNHDLFPDDNYLTIYPKDSLAYFIKEDLVENVQIYLFNRPDLNIDELEYRISYYRSYNFFETYYRSAIQLAMHYGSINCFKYLLLNGLDLGCSAHYAIAGGNLEIIHILEQKSFDFDDLCLKTAIRFHRNDIADWILLNLSYYNIYDCFKEAIFSNNVPAFLYFFIKTTQNYSYFSDSNVFYTSLRFGSFFFCIPSRK